MKTTKTLSVSAVVLSVLGAGTLSPPGTGRRARRQAG
jgi:hypothetical protein